MTIRDALQRLEAATEGSRELDEIIAKAMGWTWSYNDYWQPPEPHKAKPLPFWSTSLDCAVSLLPPGGRWSLEQPSTPPDARAFAHVNASAAFAPRGQLALAFCIAAFRARIAALPPPPVDRTQRTLVDGSAVTDDHRELKPNGQQKDYVVLSAEERAKGFVRPVRTAYVHQKCGTLTTMSRALAETYARDPAFYSGTFCCGCGAHFPVGESGEFIWDDGSRAKVGT